MTAMFNYLIVVLMFIVGVKGWFGPEMMHGPGLFGGFGGGYGGLGGGYGGGFGGGRIHPR
ncbi:unnamed protein product [Cylicocyclus nassatus]|uniref:Uncharacterized protein n=1 Tax=Cylicocyclus nassatus TaxID=53992 RepID=A0AA36GJC9_CYLNA|nr:unnamed protein product [Cylicocyclus nassatus]